MPFVRHFNSAIATALFFIVGCSSHSSYYAGYPHHHGHVSVGIHSHDSKAAAVVGALIIGGVIGHALSEASQQEQARQSRMVEQKSGGVSDEVANGYVIDEPASTTRQKGQIWYQTGQDGHCYLMQAGEDVAEIVMAVPDKRCQKR